MARSPSPRARKDNTAGRDTAKLSIDIEEFTRMRDAVSLVFPPSRPSYILSSQVLLLHRCYVDAFTTLSTTTINPPHPTASNKALQRCRMVLGLRSSQRFAFSNKDCDLARIAPMRFTSILHDSIHLAACLLSNAQTSRRRPSNKHGR